MSFNRSSTLSFIVGLGLLSSWISAVSPAAGDKSTSGDGIESGNVAFYAIPAAPVLTTTASNSIHSSTETDNISSDIASALPITTENEVGVALISDVSTANVTIASVNSATDRPTSNISVTAAAVSFLTNDTDIDVNADTSVIATEASNLASISFSAPAVANSIFSTIISADVISTDASAAESINNEAINSVKLSVNFSPDKFSAAATAADTATSTAQYFKADSDSHSSAVEADYDASIEKDNIVEGMATVTNNAANVASIATRGDADNIDNANDAAVRPTADFRGANTADPISNTNSNTTSASPARGRQVAMNTISQSHRSTENIRPAHGAERRLFDLLFYDYDPGSRPVISAKKTVTVRISVSLTHIVDLVERNQTLMTQLWIYEDWMDEMLRWDPLDFDGLTSLIVPSPLVWLPDIYIFNNADRGREGFVLLNESRVTLHYNGKIEWIVPLTVQSACSVDVTYFPFDKQLCTIHLGSWIYDEAQMNVTLFNEEKAELDLIQYSPNSELDLVDTGLTRDILPTNYHVSGSMRGGVRPQITASLRVRRKPLYYVYTVLAPTLVLCILNLFSFLLPCDNGDKVGIGLTVFLSLYVLQLAIAEHIPESNSLPLIGLFLTLVMTLNAISLMCATLVINIKKKGDLRHCPHVPDNIMSLAKALLARLTCTPFINFYHYYGNCEINDDDDEINDVTGDVSRATKSRRGLCCHGGNDQSICCPRGLSKKRSRKRSNKDQNFNETSSSLQTSFLLSDRRLTLAPHSGSTDGLTTPDYRTMAGKEPRDPRYEWFFVAEILDKTLFLLFFLTMLTTVIVSLVVVPWIHS